MKYNEIKGIAESPQIVQATNFGLDNAVKNTELAVDLLKKKKEDIESTKTHNLIRTGDMQNGSIALIRNSKPPKVDYLIKYEEMNKLIAGKTVTQVLLWRSTGEIPSGYTSHVFYNILLDRWPTIMSDSQQTDRGREFWINRMKDATLNGYEVGMVNFNSKKVVWYDSSEHFTDWLKNQDGWGKEDSYQAKRFLISKNKF